MPFVRKQINRPMFVYAHYRLHDLRIVLCDRQDKKGQATLVFLHLTTSGKGEITQASQTVFKWIDCYIIKEC